MKVCHFCGAQNEDWMKICQECGNPVIDTAKVILMIIIIVITVLLTVIEHLR